MVQLATTVPQGRLALLVRMDWLVPLVQPATTVPQGRLALPELTAQ